MAVRGGDSRIRPDICTQKTEIHVALQQRLKKGDTWYLVDVRWMKQWKKYVGYDQWDQSSAGIDAANPGPMESTNLFRGDGCLREHMMDELDYFLLPETAWNKLYSWYGVSPGSRVVARKVVEHGLYMKHCKVEVYLLEFKMCVHPNLNDFTMREFSRGDTVAKLEQSLRGIYDVDSHTECRVWHRYMKHTYEHLSKPDQTLQDTGLYNGQMIFLEKKNSDGSWPRRTTTKVDASIPKDFGRFFSSIFNSQVHISGLRNLDNTGCMNSVLQCLSNSVPLTKYFIGKHGAYETHVNNDNPLGVGGPIAKAFRDLLLEMWSGKSSVVSPQSFKVDRSDSELCKHDALEFLSFLLDGLHEDLNLVKKKPYYVDIAVKTDGQSDSDVHVAEETWYQYLLRNHSIIVELFIGQLKSTLTCPDCSEVHNSFEPFNFLSLPLPNKMQVRTISVYLVRIDPMAPIVKFKVQVANCGIIWNLKEELGTLSGVNAKQLVIVDVYNSRFHRIFVDRDPLSNIVDRDDIYAYELEIQRAHGRKMVHVPVYLREEKSHSHSIGNYYRLFGLPLTVCVPAECTYRSLYTAIINKLRRYLKISSVETNQDLFKLVVVNSYGSENIRKLVDNPKRMLQLSGSTYIACDWEEETKEYYNAKEHEEHVSCKFIHLMNCFKQFVSKKTLTVEDKWYCPQCKSHVQATKKSDVWSLPELLVVHLKRFTNDKVGQLDTFIDFPVSGLDLTDFVLKENDPQPLYDLYAVSNCSTTKTNRHYTGFTKDEETGKWYHFDSSAVSELTEDRVVTAAAYVLFYRRRLESHPVRSIPESQLTSSKDRPSGVLSVTAHQLELSTRIEELESAKEELKNQLSAKELEVAEKSENLMACQTEFEACTVELVSKNEEFVALKTELEAELSSKNEELVTLKKELEGARKELAAHNIDVWKISRDKIVMEREIGHGGWGAVFEGKIRVAIKRLHPAILNPINLTRLQREMSLLAEVRHPNLVQFIGAVLERVGNEPPLIITELLDMNLRQAYEQKEIRPENRLSIFVDVARALDYLHQRYEPIIHRDVSAPNVLLQRQPNNQWKGKLSDLGSANFLENAQTMGEGAIIYSPPEVIPQPYALDLDSEPPQQTVKIDVYSYGILLCEVSTSTFPSHKNYREMFRQILREQPQMYALIVRCTKKDPNDRPTMAEVLVELDNMPHS